MAEDNLEEAMMNIINAGAQYGADENPDFDDGSQYLNFDGVEQENVVQENAAGEVYY